MRHVWRNRVCYDTTKLKKDPNCWATILHKRIADYFNIYSQILNYQMFMLVSHRDMISVYKMSTIKDDWKTCVVDGG